MRVLIVDDSPEVRARLVTLLREVDEVVAIDEAATAAEALIRTTACRPDVVILDINMPGGNGLSILPSLRALPSPPVVIVLTNDPTGHHRRQSLASGAQFFFDKSKHFDSVLEVLRGRSPTLDG